jgi:hypothetical protein
LLPVIGIALAAAGGAIIGASTYHRGHDTLVSTLGGIVAVAGMALSGFGAGVARNWLRMRHVLGSQPWTERRCRFEELRVAGMANGQPTLVLDGHAILCIVSAVWRWRQLNDYDGRTVWFAGDVRRGGVVSPPGGGYLLLARPPRGLVAKRVRENAPVELVDG